MAQGAHSADYPALGPVRHPSGSARLLYARAMLTIVLARVEQDQVVVKQGRIDLGERHTFASVDRPVAMIWLNAGDAADVERAQTYARQNDYVVFTYPTTEPEPLQRARLDVLKKHS